MVITTHQKQLNIGARVLLPEQAEKLLSGYSTINTQVREFRKQAEQYRKLNEQYRKQAEPYKKHIDLRSQAEYDKQFVNTISILGGRGSGKTSVLLTLKHYYQSQNKNLSDIVLPLIVPDQISAPNNTLGWILSFLNEELINLEAVKKEKELRGRATHHTFEHCTKENRSDLEHLFDLVYKKYLFRSEEYHKLIQRRDEGIAEFKKDNLDIINADHQLIQTFRKFVDELLKRKHELNPSDQEPLLFIFFDDVDISSHRCQEVLDTIRIYLTHPNVVVFVSGDYLEFSEAMTLDFLRKDKIEKMDLDESFISTTISERMQLKGFGTTSYKQEVNALDIRKERSQEYLKKVFPPAFRFKMKPLTHQEKASFFYETVDESGNACTSEITLKYLLSRINITDKEALQDEIGFSFDGLEDVYFRAFDENPRGLINPYYFLYSKQNEIWTLEDLERLFTIMVGSTQLLRDYEHDIRSFILFDRGAVDYKRLDIFFERLVSYRNKEDGYYPLDHIVTLFSAALLFDYLFNRLNRKLKRGQEREHGEILLRFLNYHSKWLYPKENHTAKLIALYDKLSASIPPDALNNLFKETEGHNLKLLLEMRYFEELTDFYVNRIPVGERPFISDREQGIVQLFEYMAFHDLQWLNLQLEFVLKTGRNFQDILAVTEQETYEELLTMNSDYIGLVREIRNPSNMDEVMDQIHAHVNEWINSNYEQNAADKEIWANLYGKLYKFFNVRLEEDLYSSTIDEDDVKDQQATTHERFFEQERIRNKIYYYRRKPEFKFDVELVEDDQVLTSAFASMEQGSITRQLERIMSSEKLSLEEKFKNCLQIIDITLNSYKSRFTVSSNQLKITGDITRALEEIINLHLHPTIDELCLNLTNAVQIKHEIYNDLIQEISNRVFMVLDSHAYKVAFRHKVQRVIEYLQGTMHAKTHNSNELNDIDTHFFKRVYTSVYVNLFPLYIHLKAYVRYMETQDNEAIKYFRKSKHSIINYYYANRYVNRTAFIKLLETHLERESH